MYIYTYIYIYVCIYVYLTMKLLRRDQDGKLVILDWKRSAKAKNYQGQLNLYKYLLEENYTLDGLPILIERFPSHPLNPEPHPSPRPLLSRPACFVRRVRLASQLCSKMIIWRRIRPHAPEEYNRGTSIMRNSDPLGPYSSNMSRPLWQTWGGGSFL